MTSFAKTAVKEWNCTSFKRSFICCCRFVFFNYLLFQSFFAFFWIFMRYLFFFFFSFFNTPSKSCIIKVFTCSERVKTFRICLSTLNGTNGKKQLNEINKKSFPFVTVFVNVFRKKCVNKKVYDFSSSCTFRNFNWQFIILF